MIVGILLAAGRGRRFDPTGVRDKLLEPVDGVPVALRAFDCLAGSCDRVVAVVRPSADQLARLLAARGAQVVECAAAQSGMGHSLAAGAAAILSADIAPVDAIAVMPADLPWVQSMTVERVIAALNPCDPLAIAAPAFRNRRGHPVVFGRTHLSALSRLDGDRGARDILDAFRVMIVDVDDGGILRDIDTLEDLARG